MPGNGQCMLSYIVVNYNVKEHVNACINSILEFTPLSLPCEIIVVDNASTDGSREQFANDERISYLYNEENSGFGIGNNQAARLATGEFLVVLNPDVRLTSETDISGLIAQFRETPELGQLSCRIFYGDGSIQTMGEVFPSLPGEIFRNLMFLGSRPVKARLLARKKIHSKPTLVDWVSGSFFVIPRALFNQLGGFDESIFLNAEDLDLSARIHQFHRTVAVKTDHSVVHLHGAAKRKAKTYVGGIAAWRALASTEYVIQKNNLSRFPRLIRALRWANKMIMLVAHKIWARPQSEVPNGS